MSKQIFSYLPDGTPDLNDKLIGSNSSDNVTYNYKLSTIFNLLDTLYQKEVLAFEYATSSNPLTAQNDGIFTADTDIIFSLNQIIVNSISYNSEDVTSLMDSLIVTIASNSITFNIINSEDPSNYGSFSATAITKVGNTYVIDGSIVGAFFSGSLEDGAVYFTEPNLVVEGITDIVQDLTPQLGGVLDENGFGVMIEETVKNVTVGQLLTSRDDTVGGIVYSSTNATAGGDNSGKLGIALETATSGAKKILTRGIYNSVGAFTGGQEYFMGNTAGTITANTTGFAATDIIRSIGYAIDDDNLYFNPSGSWITKDGSKINNINLSLGQVDSIVDLKALTGISIGNVINTTSYYGDNNGGGNTFVKVTDTGQVDNGGTIIIGTDLSVYEATEKTIIDVKQFGAKGDNSADDITFINKAIQAIKTTGGIINFSGGTYLVSDTVLIDGSNIKLKLSPDTIIKNTNTTTGTYPTGGGLIHEVVRFEADNPQVVYPTNKNPYPIITTLSGEYSINSETLNVVDATNISIGDRMMIKSSEPLHFSRSTYVKQYITKVIDKVANALTVERIPISFQVESDAMYPKEIFASEAYAADVRLWESKLYKITTPSAGTELFTDIGAANNNIGTTFYASSDSTAGAYTAGEVVVVSATQVIIPNFIENVSIEGGTIDLGIQYTSGGSELHVKGVSFRECVDFFIGGNINIINGTKHAIYTDMSVNGIIKDVVINNQGDYNNTYGVYGIYMSSSQNINVTDNYIHNLFSGIDTNLSYNIIIENNLCYNCELDPHSGKDILIANNRTVNGGIVVRCLNMDIIDNVINNALLHPIDISEGAEQGYINIIGNTISRDEELSPTSSTIFGIYNQSTNSTPSKATRRQMYNHTVKNNTIRNYSYGIRYNSSESEYDNLSKNVIISDNNIYNFNIESISFSYITDSEICRNNSLMIPEYQNAKAYNAVDVASLTGLTVDPLFPALSRINTSRSTVYYLPLGADATVGGNWTLIGSMPVGVQVLGASANKNQRINILHNDIDGALDRVYYVTNTDTLNFNSVIRNENATDTLTDVSYTTGLTIREDSDFNNFGITGLRDMTFETGETVSWNDDFNTLNIPTGTGSILQVGQEFYFLIYNDTGVQINNGEMLKPVAGFVVGSNVIPTVILAKADNHTTCEGTLFMATSDIANAATGMATRIGRVSGVDMSSFSIGDDLYLSPTTAGAVTNVRPEFPDYTITIGGVLNNIVSGALAYNVTRNVQDTILSAWDGGMREGFDFIIASNGSVITGSLEQKGTGDLTMIFSDGLAILDCTPQATIVLTAGTDTVPQRNYVYVLKSTKVLTVSTSEFPTTEHIKIADVFLRSATVTQTDDSLANRNWNDHIKTTDNNGHLLHIAEKLRQGHADWSSGAAGTSTVSAATSSDVWASVTAGKIYQLHKQTFPAADSSTGDGIHIVNHSSTPYVEITNLNTQTLDALGNTLAGFSFSYVLWGVQNKTGETSHMMLNLPAGHYAKNSPDNAVSDALNYSVYSIPNDFKGTGFLIARFTYILQANGTDWALHDTEDLRGKTPNTTAGGGAGGTGVTEWTQLTDTPSAYTSEAGNVPVVNSGETALEFQYLGSTADTGVALSLTNTNGIYYNMSAANSGTTYTTAATPILGCFALCLINTTSEPVVTGATKVAGATWVTGTNMYMGVDYNGNREEFYFIEI